MKIAWCTLMMQWSNFTIVCVDQMILDGTASTAECIYVVCFANTWIICICLHNIESSLVVFNQIVRS